MSERRDDRSDIEVILHRLTMRIAELDGRARTWAGRSDAEVGLRARPAVDKAIAAARAIAALGNDAVEVLQLEAETYDIERRALVPGDEVRRWPSDVV